MPLFLNPRFAVMLMIGLPVLGGAVVHPQGATAFVLGAWAGALLAGPPLMILMWLLGLRTLGQVLRPLTRLPVLIALTVALIYFSGADLGLGTQLLGLGGLALWLRKRAGLSPL